MEPLVVQSLAKSTLQVEKESTCMYADICKAYTYRDTELPARVNTKVGGEVTPTLLGSYLWFPDTVKYIK